MASVRLRICSRLSSTTWSRLSRSTSAATSPAAAASARLRRSKSIRPSASAGWSRIFRLTSWSEVSTPAELSIASVLILPPAIAYSMRARWVKPRLPPSATALARSSLAAMRQASLAWSPTSASRLVAGAHVGADAAVVEQGHIGAQDGLDEAVAVEHLGRAGERAAGLRAERDALGAAAKDAAAGTDQRRVVVRPLRGGQLEQPLALGEALFRIGVGIDEDVAMVEGGDELEVVRLQEPVAEHVARHVADPDHRDRRAAREIDSHLAQVPADRLPRAARGDAERLVVVAVARRPRRKRRPARSCARPRSRWPDRKTPPCPCRPRPPGRGRPGRAP